jgi:hypothetical protein
MSDDGKYQEVFTIEGEQRDSSNNKSYYSAIKKYAINIQKLQSTLP